MRCYRMEIVDSNVRVEWFGLMAVTIASDEPLLERLRILVSDPSTDSHVKNKAVELFISWSVNFRNEKGMEKLAELRSQLPTRVMSS